MKFVIENSPKKTLIRSLKVKKPKIISTKKVNQCCFIASQNTLHLTCTLSNWTYKIDKDNLTFWNCWKNWRQLSKIPNEDSKGHYGNSSSNKHHSSATVKGTFSLDWKSERKAPHHTTTTCCVPSTLSSDRAREAVLCGARHTVLLHLTGLSSQSSSSAFHVATSMAQCLPSTNNHLSQQGWKLSLRSKIQNLGHLLWPNLKVHFVMISKV